MKKLFALAVLLFVTANVSAQNTTLDKWPAMKTFHEVMARCYHPVEEGNLAPLRNFAETLDNKAKELTTGEIPRDLKTKELMAAIKDLQEKTYIVNKLVKTNAADEPLKKAITEAHEAFHKIIGMCSGEKK